jgi:hypothetical protein
MPKDRRNIFRKNHPKLRNSCRARNYKKSRPAVRKNQSWASEEMHYLLACSGICTDRSMARELNRSVQAIQQKRYKLRKEYYENNKVTDQELVWD